MLFPWEHPLKHALKQKFNHVEAILTIDVKAIGPWSDTPMIFGELYDSLHFWERLKKLTLVSKWVRDMPHEIFGHTKFLLWSF